MNLSAQRRRELKFHARQLFFRYRRPCLVAALLLLCVSFLAQFFSAYTGGALFYTFMDVQQLPLDTGLWLAQPEIMENLMSTMGLQGLGNWGGLLLTLRYDPAGMVVVLPLAWRQLLNLVVVNAVVLLVTSPLEFGVLAQLRRVMEGRPQRLHRLFDWYLDLRLTGKALAVQVVLTLWRVVTALVCALPGLLCLVAGTALPNGESLLFLSTVLSVLGMLAAYGCYTLLLPARFLLAASPKLSARQALSQGLALTRGRRIEYCYLNLSFLPWTLVSRFFRGVPDLYVYPYTVLTNYLFLGAVQPQAREG